MWRRVTNLASLAAVALLTTALACVEDDPCAGATCSDHGTCAVALGVAACTCEDGFTATEALECVNQVATACNAAITAKRQALIDNGSFTEQEISAWDFGDAPTMTLANPGAAISAAMDDSGNYWDDGGISGYYWDDLAIHPGCAPRLVYDGDTDIFNSATTNSSNEATVPSGSGADGTNSGTLLQGYQCAAKIYDARPSGFDDGLPIVVLMPGNSGSPNHFEEYFRAEIAGTTVTSGSFEYTLASTVQESLATKLVALGYQVFSPDMRPDQIIATLDGAVVATEFADPSFGDAFGSMDHGWGSPILQHFMETLMTNTDQQISMVGHSYGYSLVRDSLRRIYMKHKAGNFPINPYTRIRDLVLCSGTAHGVRNGDLECSTRSNLRSKCNCQMGDRESYIPTDFNKALNGPNDLYATPCADASTAYGETGVCEDHAVRYTTITMRDVEDGVFQDEYVSEGASALNIAPCVSNELISSENGFDTSGFFYGGALLANHLGAIRSQEGIAKIIEALR